MIDLLFVAWNRLQFTRASIEALIENTNWDLVRLAVIHDDGSTDGTRELLEEAIHDIPGETLMSRGRVGGPVATMNAYLDMPDRPEYFAKVDNDFVMPPDWLDDLWHVLDASPELDILGTEPMLGLDTDPEVTTGDVDGELVGYTPCSHIGGKGLIRASAFVGRPMWAQMYNGFTQWQHKHEDVVKGWITPDLKSFGLDQLPFEPWRSLTDEYVRRGWQRRWPAYSPDADAYWSWWTSVPTP